MDKDKRKQIMAICTGGTIAMLPQGSGGALVPATWDQIKEYFAALQALPFDVEMYQMEPIDSSDMHPDYWVSIARVIRDNYTNYDGFVVLHGTDTMAYTASALSFLLENLDKPVIVTGSQLPLATPRNDASQNLVTALTIAAAADGLPVVPEVSVLFNNKLYRGNRTRKVSSNGFDGFNSPNLRPLAEIGEHIKIDEKIILRPFGDGLFINEHFDPNVMIFDIFPGISPKILKKVFDIEGLRGVILRTYGAGNAPTSEELLEEIEEAIKDKKITFVNITQCVQGMVEMGLYDASVKLSQIGVISGVDMTPEAALVKMMFLLGQGYEKEEVKEQMQKNLRGEQSVNVFNFIYEKGKSAEGVSKLATQQLSSGFAKEKITKANIRFDKVKIVGDGKGEMNLSVFMNYPAANADTPTDIPQCLGTIKNFNAETDFMLECTKRVSQVITPGRPVQLTVVVQNGDISWGGLVFSIFTDAIE